MRPIELNQRRAAPAGPAAGQAFYTPADPRAALERSPAMELTERARPAQGGTGGLMGPVLQRYQAEQAAAATAYDGAEEPGVLSRIWAGAQDLAGDFADKEEPYWEKFRRGDVAGGLVNFAAVTAGLPQSLYLNGLNALLDLLAGKRPEFHYNMDGMDYLREIEERTGAPGAYTWLTEKQGSENLGDRLVGNLLGLGYNLGTDPASYLTAAGTWKAGQAGTPGTPAYGEYVSSGRAADSLSGAARQDAARAWDEGEENRSWETEAEPVDIPEEAGIIKITLEYRAGRELLNSIESVEDFVTEPSKLSHVDPDALYDYLKESGYEVKPLGRGNFRDIPYEDGGGFRIHWDM